MKKFFILALVAMIGATAFSKTIDEVFNAFPKADNVQEITIDKAMLDMAKAMGKPTKDVDAMRVITIENPSSDQLAILKAIMDEGVEGFDVMIDADEEGGHALILTQGDDKEIHKMLIIASEKDEVAIVLIEGKIDPSNADKMINLGK